MWTTAEVLIRRGVKPAAPRTMDSAIEKQPAWAAPKSSSGLASDASSKREAKEPRMPENNASSWGMTCPDFCLHADLESGP